MIWFVVQLLVPLAVIVGAVWFLLNLKIPVYNDEGRCIACGRERPLRDGANVPPSGEVPFA